VCEGSMPSFTLFFFPGWLFKAAFLVSLFGTHAELLAGEGVMAPWRGEREWVPVSNPALCRVVGMREDGRTLRLFSGFRGRRANFSSPPLGSPIWTGALWTGALPPEHCSRVHNWVSPHFLFLWLFLSSPSACVSCGAWPVL